MRTFLKYIKSRAVLLSALFIAGLATVFTVQAVHDTELFELDGNSSVESTADDWDIVYDRVGDGTPLPLPPGNFDANFVEDNLVAVGNKLYDVSVYTTGSSDTKDISEWGCTKKTKVGSKFDFEHGYASAYEYINDMMEAETYIALGANRIGVNGNSAVGIWLVQDDIDCEVPLDSSGSGDWVGNHFDGDLLITSDFENGGRLGVVNVFNWVGDAATGSLVMDSSFGPGEADCQYVGPMMEDHHDAIPSVCLTTNGARESGTTIITPWAGMLDAGQFVEGAINITEYFGELGKPEPCFNTMVIQARASSSASAHTHDYIVVPINTCGKVILEKETHPAGDPQTFSFNFGPQPGTPVPVGPEGGISDGQAIPIIGVTPGTYQASEDEEDGWDLTGVDCLDNYDEDTMMGVAGDSDSEDNINVSRGETVHCLFTNVKRSTIIIKKVVNDPRGLAGDESTFGFTATGLASPFSIAVDTSSTGTFMNTRTFNDLDAGTYVVTEDDPSVAGFSLTGLSCDDDASATPSTVDLDTRTATIKLDPGETVTCTYTNERLAAPGGIIIEKMTVGGAGAFNFDIVSAPDDPMDPSLPPVLPLATTTNNPNEFAFTTVPAGVYTITEQASDDFDLTGLVCGINEGLGVPPGVSDPGTSVDLVTGVATVDIDDGEVVRCIFTNSRLPQLKVVKTLIPNSDSGKFNLQIDGATEATDVGDGGDTGFHNVSTGSHDVGELAGTGTSLDDYNSSVSCDNGDSADSATGLTTTDLSYGDQVTCTITNSRLPQLKVVKALIPNSDSGKFNLQIDGVTEATDVGDGGDTGFHNVSTGSHDVGELAGTSTSLANYDSSVSCSNGDSADSATGLTTSDLSYGDQVTCTITNSRLPQLKVVKALIPNSDPGKFNLQIDGATEAADVGDGGDTGFHNVTTGSHDVGELAGTGTNLSNYDSSVSCNNGDSANSATGLTTSDLSYGDQVTCTITNSRLPQLKVVKALIPSSDTGKFNLQIDGSTEAGDVGNGGDTGFHNVSTGSHSVGELAGTGTSLGNYDSSVSCNNGDSANSATGLTTSALSYGDQVTCTITNSRLPQLKVVKALIPNSDPGKFNLQIDGSTKAGDVGNGGDTGFHNVSIGSHSVGELAGTGTSLANYDSSVSCNNGDNAGSATGLTTSALSYGDQVTCTITNSRLPQLKVVKALIPSSDTGKFNLQIDGTTEAGDVGNGGDTGFHNVSTGSHSVGELAGTGTSLANYDSSVSCNNGDSTNPGTSLSTSDLSYGDVVTCTITNNRRLEAAGLLIIDEDSIDNNSPSWWDYCPPDNLSTTCSNPVKPRQNNGYGFTASEVNDDKPGIGQRDILRFFSNHVGETIQLFTGQVGDEGWFAPQYIPDSWNSYDPGGDGLYAFLDGVVPQNRLDKIDDVTPLRATALVGLKGKDICAVVYDSDISINYDPLNGNLQGETLGILAFHVLDDSANQMHDVEKAKGFSSSTLPTVTVTILDAAEACSNVEVLQNIPMPPTSSEPADIDPDNLTGGYL